MAWREGVLEVGPGDLYQESYLVFKMPSEWLGFNHVMFGSESKDVWQIDQHNSRVSTINIDEPADMYNSRYPQKG